MDWALALVPETVVASDSKSATASATIEASPPMAVCGELPVLAVLLNSAPVIRPVPIAFASASLASLVAVASSVA